MAQNYVIFPASYTPGCALKVTLLLKAAAPFPILSNRTLVRVVGGPKVGLKMVVWMGFVGKEGTKVIKRAVEKILEKETVGDFAARFIEDLYFVTKVVIDKVVCELYSVELAVSRRYRYWSYIHIDYMM